MCVFKKCVSDRVWMHVVMCPIMCVCVWDGWQKQPSATCLAWKMIQVSQRLAAVLWPCRKKGLLPLSLSHTHTIRQENNLRHQLGGGVQKTLFFTSFGIFHKWRHKMQMPGMHFFWMTSFMKVLSNDIFFSEIFRNKNGFLFKMDERVIKTTALWFELIGVVCFVSKLLKRNYENIENVIRMWKIHLEIIKGQRDKLWNELTPRFDRVQLL
jgi:hypothetical protein